MCKTAIEKLENIENTLIEAKKEQRNLKFIVQELYKVNVELLEKVRKYEGNKHRNKN